MSEQARVDYEAVCETYRQCIGGAATGKVHGISQGYVSRIVSRRMPKKERDSIAQILKRRAGARLSASIQSEKIARGDVSITIRNSVAYYEMSGRTWTVDAEDAHILRQYAWRPSSTGRLVRQARGEKKNIYIYHDVLGVEPNMERVVDHINGDPTDNTKRNLRVCSWSENNLNRECHRLHSPKTKR